MSDLGLVLNAGAAPATIALSEPSYFDEAAVRLLCEQLKRVAGDVEGDFCLATIHDDTGKTQHYSVANGPHAVEQLVAKTRQISVEHQNIHFSGALFRSGSIVGNKGRTEANAIGALCAVSDFDAANEPKTRHDRLPCAPSAEIETSSGNYQCLYFLPHPCAVKEAKPVFRALTKVSRADGCFSADHLWRMPGTWNWPNAKKRAKGRKPEPAAWSECPAGTSISIEELRAAIPESVTIVEEDTSTPVGGDFDWNHRTQECEALDTDTIIKELSKKGVDRSTVMFGLIKRMRDGGYSPREIAVELWKYHNLPVMERYDDHDRWQADVQRIVDKLIRTSKDGKPLPVIRLDGGKLPANIEACEKALKAAEIGVYQQGERLIELGEVFVDTRDGAKEKDLLLTEMSPMRLVELLTSVVEFKKPVRGGLSTVNCPESLARGYIARVGHWSVNPLFGVISAPTLRLDGSVLDAPGYDEQTHLFYSSQGSAFPSIPAKPTRGGALAALAVLDELIGEFPFATDAARSVARSALLTSVTRRVLPAAPLFGIDGTGAGSGKGKLADTISIVGSGRRATTINYGASEEEFDKRMSSVLMRGDLGINIDNVSHDMGGDQLCTLLTQNPCDMRILCRSHMMRVPTNSLIMVTGNSLSITGDLCRRTLISLIDPKMDRPSEREFSFCPVERARENRGRYVVACLTILHAYNVAGRPSQGGKTFGSFEEWCRVIRDPLLWLGCDDPVNLTAPQTDDPARELLGSLVMAWKSDIGENVSVTLKKATQTARDNVDDRSLLDALVAVTDDGSGRVNTTRLAGYLRKKKGQPIHGFRFVKGEDTDRSGSGTWRLEKI